MQNDLNEQEIIERAKHGEVRSFEWVVNKFRRYVFVIAFRILCNEDEANEVVHESFIKVWRNFTNYNNSIKFTTWLYKIAVNLCYDKLKSRKRKMTIDITDDMLANLLQSEQNPENEFSNAQLAEKIKLLSEHLPPKQKIIFIMRDLHDLSINEVATITGMSESSVKTNLVYARRTIKEKLIRWMN
jgi:RNA polymerase sigma-70 factor (ECF subfamily)